jgi:glycosyltransferase involved in cell wall biosynthesis
MGFTGSVQKLMAENWCFGTGRNTPEDPKISVIIPVGPGETDPGYLDRVFDSVRVQDYKGPGPVQIVAVCNGSPYSAREVAGKKADVVLDYKEPLGFSRARNRGTERATGDIDVYLDADMEMEDPSTLTKIAKSIRNGNDYVGGMANSVPDTETCGENAYFGWTNLVAKYATKLANLPVIGRLAPRVGNSFIYCRSDLNLRFDEGLEKQEDVDFVGQMRNYGKVDFLDNTHIKTSGRRFRREGPVKAWAKRAYDWLEYVRKKPAPGIQGAGEGSNRFLNLTRTYKTGAEPDTEALAA